MIGLHSPELKKINEEFFYLMCKDNIPALIAVNFFSDINNLKPMEEGLFFFATYIQNLSVVADIHPEFTES